MKNQVDLIPEHVASRIIAINEQLRLQHAMAPVDRLALQREQSQLWDDHFPGKAFEEIATLVPVFLLAA